MSYRPSQSRFYRSTREAFPFERFPAVFGPYRSRRLSWFLYRALGWMTLAGLGVLLAWRG